MVIKDKKRKIFESFCNKYEAEGYAKEQITYNIRKVNVVSFITTVVIVLSLLGIYYVVTNTYYTINALFFLFLVMDILVGALLIVVFKMMLFVAFAKSRFAAVAITLNWKHCSISVKCYEPLLKRKFIFASLLPSAVLGLISGVVGILYKNFTVYSFAIIMVTFFCIELYMLTCIADKTLKNKRVLYCNIPDENGTLIFYK